VVDARSRFGPVATVVDGGQPVEMRTISEDLGARGVQRLMVEGGGMVHTQFLTDNLADELQLVVAPFFVGDSRATRFVNDGRFRGTPAGARRSPRCARSATWCCCATRSRRGLLRQSQQVRVIHGDGDEAAALVDLQFGVLLASSCTPPSNHAAMRSACAAPSRHGLGRVMTSAP